MSTWLSAADVAQEFGLTGHTNDPAALRNELRKVMSELHPDKNAGDFKSDEEKKKFLHVKDALEFLDAQTQNAGALIPISQLPAIIKAFSEAIAPRTVLDINTLHAKAIAETRTHL